MPGLGDFSMELAGASRSYYAIYPRRGLPAPTLNDHVGAGRVGSVCTARLTDNILRGFYLKDVKTFDTPLSS